MKFPRDDAIKSALVNTAGALLLSKDSPDEALGELFLAVQKHQIYDDGKTFVDLIPRGRMKQIKKEYLIEKEDPNFNLHEFVARHFSSTYPGGVERLGSSRRPGPRVLDSVRPPR